MKIVIQILVFIGIVGFWSCENSENEIAPQGSIHLIYDFSPLSGPIGSEVTIHGMHFSEVPEENEVRFRSAEAEVLESNGQQLRVKVPQNAQTGKISVTVDETTTISTEEFIVM